MNKITFGSTYRIPLTEQHMTQPRREKLKQVVSQYQNVLIPSSNTGNIRISIRKRLDDRFEKELHDIGVRIYQKFDRHNINKRARNEDGTLLMDSYIKEQLNTGEYIQKGKQKARLQNK